MAAGEAWEVGGVRIRTYREIKACVKQPFTGRTLHHDCHIAEVKRELGLTRGPAPNRGMGKGAPPCPPWARQAILACLCAERVS